MACLFMFQQWNSAADYQKDWHRKEIFTFLVSLLYLIKKEILHYYVYLLTNLIPLAYKEIEKIEVKMLLKTLKLSSENEF